MFSYISLPPFNVLREYYGGAFSKGQPHFHFRNEPCLAVEFYSFAMLPDAHRLKRRLEQSHLR